MRSTVSLLTAAAVGSLFATSAQAAERSHGHHAHRARTRPASTAPKQEEQNATLKQEVADLRAEVESLKQTISSEHEAQVATSAQVQTLNTQVAAAPAAAREEAKTEIATAIEKEHHRDAIGYKGIRLQPGGFLEFAGI